MRLSFPFRASFLPVAIALSRATAVHDAPPLPPIVIRHDRPDSAYVRLGARYPAVVQIGRAGDGTLIAPDWVLTAAHVAAGVNPERALVRVGDSTYRIMRRIW